MELAESVRIAQGLEVADMAIAFVWVLLTRDVGFVYVVWSVGKGLVAVRYAAFPPGGAWVWRRARLAILAVASSVRRTCHIPGQSTSIFIPWFPRKEMAA